MKQTVLLYNFTDPNRLAKVQQALLPLGFRLRIVRKEDYKKPVGALAGVKGMEDEAAAEPSGGEGARGGEIDFSDEMAVMAGVTSAQVDAFIRALRRNGGGRIDYKAVLTPYNKNWDSVRLYREIRREHESMSAAIDGGQGGAT